MMSNELSEYEKKRLENIKQNQEILKSLNIKGIIPDELKKTAKSVVPTVKKARVNSEDSRTTSTTEALSARRVSSRLLKKTGILEGLDEDYVKIESSEIFKNDLTPPKPKRIVGKIPFDPEEGATTGFLELTGSLLGTNDLLPSVNNNRLEKEFENGVEIQNELSVIKVMKERIYSIAVHPDPSKILIAAGGKFGELSFLDGTDTSHPVKMISELPEAKSYHPGVYSFRPHTGSISNLRYNPANSVQLISTSYDNIVRCLDIATGTFDELYNFGEDTGDVVTGFDLDSSGNLFYFSDTNGIFRWADRRLSEKNGIIKEIRLHEKKIGCVSVCRDGKYLATASNDGTVGLWDLRKLPLSPQETEISALHTLTFRRSVTSVYFNPLDSSKLLSTCYDDHVRVHYNLTGNASHSEISHNNQTGRWITNFKAVWDPKSPNYAVVGNMNRGIDIIDAHIHVKGSSSSSAEIVRNITSDYLTAQPAVNAFHPNLDVIASGNASGKIAIWSRLL